MRQPEDFSSDMIKSHETPGFPVIILPNSINNNNGTNNNNNGMYLLPNHGNGLTGSYNIPGYGGTQGMQIVNGRMTSVGGGQNNNNSYNNETSHIQALYNNNNNSNSNNNHHNDQYRNSKTNNNNQVCQLNNFILPVLIIDNRIKC